MTTTLHEPTPPEGPARPAFAYLMTPGDARPNTELELRRKIAEYARLEGLQLESVFVDVHGESPYGFAALRVLLRRKPEVRTVVIPDLGHVASIPLVAHLEHAGLARFLGAAVHLVDPPHTASRSWAV